VFVASFYLLNKAQLNLVHIEENRMKDGEQRAPLKKENFVALKIPVSILTCTFLTLPEFYKSLKKEYIYQENGTPFFKKIHFVLGWFRIKKGIGSNSGKRFSNC
jgi:hypothetical protein